MRVLLIGIVSVISFAIAKAQAPKEKSLLWKIEAKGVAEPSYVFGTMHLICPDKLIIDETTKKSFAACKELFLEIDMDDPQMMQKAMKGMMMTGTETLEKLVGKIDYDSMNTIFKRQAGMPLSMMGKAKPMLLMSAVLPKLMPCAATEGFEKRFQEMAKARALDVKGLETIEYQMRIFDTIPYGVQAKMLKELLYNLDSTKKSFDDMVDLYVKKDIDGLNKLATQDAEFGKYEATLLDNRNKNWIPVIAKQMTIQPTFFAVGAAHLGGENGVLSLLQKQGFKVTIVKSK